MFLFVLKFVFLLLFLEGEGVRPFGAKKSCQHCYCVVVKDYYLITYYPCFVPVIASVAIQIQCPALCLSVLCVLSVNQCL
jgi:hypothetical protein